MQFVGHSWRCMYKNMDLKGKMVTRVIKEFKQGDQGNACKLIYEFAYFGGVTEFTLGESLFYMPAQKRKMDMQV